MSQIPSPSSPPGVAETLPAWPLRFNAYLKERFKVGLNLFGATVFVLSNGLAALSLNGTRLNAEIGVRMALVTAVLFLIFFHLRVFDEHKDYAIDKEAFPERVLSKGWVTLGHLRVLGGIAIALELILALAGGKTVLLWTLGLIGYTVLMLKEFGVGDWLRKQMVLYGMSHMASLYLMSLAVFTSLADLLGPGYNPFHPLLLAFAGVSYFLTYSLEIARKIRVPEDELPHVDTYSKLWGIRGAVVGTLVCQAIALVVLGVVAQGLAIGPVALGVSAVAYLLVCAALLKLVKSPESKAAKKADTMALPTFLAVNLGLIIQWVIR